MNSTQTVTWRTMNWSFPERNSPRGHQVKWDTPKSKSRRVTVWYRKFFVISWLPQTRKVYDRVGNFCYHHERCTFHFIWPNLKHCWQGITVNFTICTLSKVSHIFVIKMNNWVDRGVLHHSCPHFMSVLVDMYHNTSGAIVVVSQAQCTVTLSHSHYDLLGRVKKALKNTFKYKSIIISIQEMNFILKLIYLIWNDIDS